MNRNIQTFLVVFLLIISLNSTQAAEAESESKGYLTITSVLIDLQPGYADVHVTYKLDDAFRFLILMFGENDVKVRLLEILNFQNATLTRMDYETADLKVYDVHPVYGDGLYWFPAHEFEMIIPNLTIQSNQSCQQLFQVNRIENGIVYY
jgi:hypothetical protein